MPVEDHSDESQITPDFRKENPGPWVVPYKSAALEKHFR
jgi:hypothetical protein